MKLKRLIAIALTAFAMLFSLVGCSGETTDGKFIYDISLSKTELTLEVGTTEKLYAQYGVDGEITFTSSNESVATVDENGVVTAVSIGTAYIDVSAGEEKKICKVEVVKSNYRVVLDCGDMNMFVGVSKEIYATVYKNDVKTDLTVTWNVSNGGQLTFNGNIAVFKATSAGTYTVKASYGETACQITITVFNDASAI